MFTTNFFWSQNWGRVCCSDFPKCTNEFTALMFLPRKRSNIPLMALPRDYCQLHQSEQLVRDWTTDPRGLISLPGSAESRVLEPLCAARTFILDSFGNHEHCMYACCLFLFLSHFLVEKEKWTIKMETSQKSMSEYPSYTLPLLIKTENQPFSKQNRPGSFFKERNCIL